MKPIYIAILTMLVSQAAVAQEAPVDSLQLEGVEITGNKELPMVLYIVPWKSIERFNIESPPITSVMDMPLAP